MRRFILLPIIIGSMLTLACNNERESDEILSENSKLNIKQTSKADGEYQSYYLQHPSLFTSASVPIPETVYRIDSRSPYAGFSYDGTYNPGIFNEGFNARGINYNLTEHVLGGNNNNNANNGPSGYVATTSTIYSANALMQSITGNSLLEELNRRGLSMYNSGTIRIRVYMYIIRPTVSNFFSVNANLPLDSRYNNYRGQNEWVAVRQIPPYQINSAIAYEDTFINGVRQGYPIPVEMLTPQGNNVASVPNSTYSSTLAGYYPYNFITADVGPTRLTESQCPQCEL